MGWVVVLWRVVGGGRRVELPAPPRPKDIFGEAVGWGSVRRTGILSGSMALGRDMLFGGDGDDGGDMNMCGGVKKMCVLSCAGWGVLQRICFLCK